MPEPKYKEPEEKKKLADVTPVLTSREDPANWLPQSKEVPSAVLVLMGTATNKQIRTTYDGAKPIAIANVDEEQVKITVSNIITGDNPSAVVTLTKGNLTKQYTVVPQQYSSEIKKDFNLTLAFAGVTYQSKKETMKAMLGVIDYNGNVLEYLPPLAMGDKVTESITGKDVQIQCVQNVGTENEDQLQAAKLSFTFLPDNSYTYKKVTVAIKPNQISDFYVGTMDGFGPFSEVSEENPWKQVVLLGLTPAETQAAAISIADSKGQRQNIYDAESGELLGNTITLQTGETKKVKAGGKIFEISAEFAEKSYSEEGLMVAKISVKGSKTVIMHDAGEEIDSKGMKITFEGVVKVNE